MLYQNRTRNKELSHKSPSGQGRSGRQIYDISFIGYAWMESKDIKSFYYPISLI